MENLVPSFLVFVINVQVETNRVLSVDQAEKESKSVSDGVNFTVPLSLSFVRGLIEFFV